MRDRFHNFPTARDTGTGFALAVNTSAGSVSGDTVPEFLLNIIRLIDKKGAMGKLEIPFCTSGTNYLVARAPEHPTGKKFGSIVRYEMRSSGETIYINTNHPRFFAIRQGARLLEAAGFRLIEVKEAKAGG